MKTKFLLLLLTACLMFDSCTKEEEEQVELHIKNGAISAIFGNEITYEAELLNANNQPETIQEINWQSSNEQIATIDSEGKVELIGVGQCKIRALVKHGQQTYTTEESLKVFSSNLFTVSPNLIDGYTSSPNLEVEASYQGTTPVVFGFESSDTDIVSIGPTGKITVHKDGNCEIKVIAISIEGKPYKIVPVKLRPAIDPSIIINIVIDDNGQAIVQPTGEKQYSAKAYNCYGNEVATNFTWTIDDSNVGATDGTGKVTGLQVGNAHVDATAQGVRSNSVSFSVVEPCGHTSGPFVPEPRVFAPGVVYIPLGTTKNITAGFETKGHYQYEIISCGANVEHIVNVNSSAVTGLKLGMTVLCFGWLGAYDFTVVYVI